VLNDVGEVNSTVLQVSAALNVTMLTEFHGVNNELDDIDLAISDVNSTVLQVGASIIDKLTFEYSSGKRFAGCDGIDQDLDETADNCAEDLYPPSLVMSDELKVLCTSIENEGEFCLENSFTSASLVKSFLTQQMQVEDDCAHQDNVTISFSNSSVLESCRANLVATPVHSCDDENLFEGPSAVFHAKVDGQAPKLSCGFDLSLASGLTMNLAAGDNTTLFVKEDLSQPAGAIPLVLLAKVS
jgi:hypothetical protein